MNKCYNPYSLSGKTILVTGASSGIGRATAIEASRLGATIIAVGRNQQRLGETLSTLEGDGHVTVQCDLSVEENLQTLVKQLPKLDGVVLCAGIGNSTLLSFATQEKVRTVFQTNFMSQVELFRLLIKRKMLNKPSSVVALSSVAGYTSFEFGNGIYGSAKAALRTWMKFASKEYGPKGIRINCVSPGMTDTPMIHDGAFSEEQMDKYALKHPLGRFGKPEEIAYGIIYLLSDASSWTTGTTLLIDGGLSEM